MVCIGTDLDTSRKAVELAWAEDDMWASVGLHPNDTAVSGYTEKDYQGFLEDQRVIAVGEIGLDYFRQSDSAHRRLQEEVFIRQLDLAEANDLPCIVHCRDAHEQMMKILSARSRAKGVIHSFNGTTLQALLYIDAGWYIGLNGIVTFSSDYEGMVRSLPSDRILLETDAPYLSPVPYRGRRNEPIRVLDIGRRIATIRGEEEDVFMANCRANTLQCFVSISREKL